MAAFLSRERERGSGSAASRFGQNSLCLVFPPDKNTRAARADLFGVAPALRHVEDLAGAIGHGLLALVHDEDAVEHEPADVVIMHVAVVHRPRIERLGLDLDIAG